MALETRNFSNRFGEMVESMIVPNLVAKFHELGFEVETKTKPKVEDLHDHIERMEKLRQYADFHHDKRKYLGAMAGVVFGDGEKTYALKKGFYVIEPSGDTFTIIKPKGSNYNIPEYLFCLL